MVFPLLAIGFAAAALYQNYREGQEHGGNADYDYELRPRQPRQVDYSDYEQSHEQPAQSQVPRRNQKQSRATEPELTEEFYINGSPSFVRRTQAMLDRCKRENPKWYGYMQQWCEGFEEGDANTLSGAYRNQVGNRTKDKARIMFNPKMLNSYSQDEYEDTTVHELRHN